MGFEPTSLVPDPSTTSIWNIGPNIIALCRSVIPTINLVEL